MPSPSYRRQKCLQGLQVPFVCPTVSYNDLTVLIVLLQTANYEKRRGKFTIFYTFCVHFVVGRRAI